MSEGGKTPKRQAIQSVEIGVGILRALMSRDTPLALREVAAIAGMSRSQTHRYLVSYTNTGFVEQDPVTGLYSLGPFSLTLGLAALSRTDAIAASETHLGDLLARKRVTGLIAVWSHRGPVVIRWYDGLVPIVASIRVGSIVPVMKSAAGQCFLAFLPSHVTKELIDREMRQSGETGKEAWRKVEALRDRVRIQGYASISGTMLPGLSALAAPVFDSQGAPVAMLGLVGIDGDAVTSDPEMTKDLMSTASLASEALGYQPTD